MSEIGDPPLVAYPKALDHLFNSLGDGLLGTVEDTGIRIALEGDFAISSNLDGLGGVLQPVHPHHIVAKIAGGVKSVPCALGEDRHGDSLQTHLLQSSGELIRNMLKEGLGNFLERRGTKLSRP